MRVHFTRTLLLALIVLSLSAALSAQVGVVITIAPPPLPVYEQPICPGDGYLWTPGYWAYDADFSDYYWVPGTWVTAPEVGYLWTPPYWGWNGDGFVFYDGYWGPTVGFYGGISYGFGYFGVGYTGGRWDNGNFFYNTSVNNVNDTVIHNVYRENVNNITINHVSYNGGDGGITARPTSEEEAAAHERHIPAVAAQTQHLQAARENPAQRASTNMGKPGIAATARPGELSGSGAVAAKEAGGSYTPANRGGTPAHAESNPAQPGSPAHVRDLPPLERPTAPNTGDKNLDKKYQQQQNKQFTQQQRERDKLQKQQDQEDQKLTKQKAPDEQKQQTEQRHQQQTQQLQQKHQQEQQQLQQRQMPAERQPPKR